MSFSRLVHFEQTLSDPNMTERQVTFPFIVIRIMLDQAMQDGLRRTAVFKPGFVVADNQLGIAKLTVAIGQQRLIAPVVRVGLVELPPDVQFVTILVA